VRNHDNGASLAGEKAHLSILPMLLSRTEMPDPVLLPGRAFRFKGPPLLTLGELSMESIFTILAIEFLIKFS